jgi:predicted CXXCH cytochrome family protein
MKAIPIFSAAALLIAGAGLAMQPQAEPTKRPTARVTDCTAGGCHAEDLDFRFLHAPVAVGACDVCHVYADPVQHTFTLKHSGTAMCDFCHIGKSAPGDAASWYVGGNGGPRLGLQYHDPVLKGECTACHNPHGSNIRRLIVGDSVAQMCLSCHESVAAHAHQHTPVATGDCAGCHRPHSSVHPHLLVEQGRDLCLRCHAETVAPTGGAQAAGAAALRLAPAGGLGPILSAIGTGLVHQPVLEDCTQCHTHHGSEHPGLLTQEPAALCSSCHEGVMKTAQTATVQHPSVTRDKACLNCHAPHRSTQVSLLRAKPIEMCLECHSKEFVRPDGKVIASMASLARSGQQLHGPLANGECRGCHQVHGAAQKSLLSARYSTEMYQPFSTEAYALCFSCHNPELAQAAQTTSATRFRNGEQNLHFIHVSGQDEAGRSCRLCHAPHAGRAAPRLHEQVAYGAWSMPMEYRPTETGGTCAAGCHRSRGYDRENPVSNVVDLPAPRPASRSAR